ncbi:MAG: TonB-dependent receptor [Flavobacteriales bacterium]|nr:TonB-dependent receptor [Flavobacteriales bacterium]
MNRVLGLILFLLGSGMAFGQNYTISGKITDSTSGEDLIYSTVLVKGKQMGTVSNDYGFFSITLQKGSYTLVFEYSGYKSKEILINLNANTTLNVELAPTANMLSIATVDAKSEKRKVENKEISVVDMDIKTIKEIPVIFGEVDVLKTITLLPGIQSAGEGNSGINVRGGSQDQNLILLDEATVYNASHLLGFFSVFNGDAIKDVQVYKGGIPASNGGRLASLIDIKMKDGNNKKYGATGGIGTISSRLTVEGPIKKDTSSFMLAGRRSYADIFLPLANSEAAKQSKLYFYDFNLKTNYRISDKDKLFISGYFGKDVLGFSNLFTTSWGNSTGTLRWNHLLTKKLFSNTSLVYSNFDYGFDFSFAENAAYGLKQKIEDYYVKQDFSYYANPNRTIRYGVQITRHFFSPGTFYPANEETAKNFTELVLEKKHALENALYYDDQIKFNPRFNVRYGLRFSSFSNIGGTEYTYTKDEVYKPVDTLTVATKYGKNEIYNTYWGFEPRLAVSYNLTTRMALKGSYNRTYQYIQQATNTASAFPTDQWFSSNLNIKPQSADQVSAGLFQNFKNGIETSVEVYYKWMHNQIDYRNEAQLFFNENLDGELLLGKGNAYGTELYINKTKGKVTGFISYTLAKTTRTTEGINNGNPYRANFDLRNNLAIVLNTKIVSRLSATAAFIYTTGKPFTSVEGKYFFEGQWNSIYGKRNSTRIPDYHRLDVGFTWKNKDSKKFKSSWNFSVYNAYNRANAYAVYFRKATQKDAAENATIKEGDDVAVQVTLFKIIPAITWNFEF